MPAPEPVPGCAPEPILGYAVEPRTIEGCAADIINHIKSDAPPAYLACLNTYSYVEAQKDKYFSAALHGAKWLVPDGAGILLASHGKLKKRLTGDDIFSALSAAAPMRVFFMGASEQTLSKIAARFGDDYPQHTLAGMLSPPFKPAFSASDSAAMIKKINTARPDILWVGLTAPKQEKWLHAHIDRLDIRFAAGIGAVFDFYAGNTPRAPKWMQERGMEWLYRLLQNPRKLARRYLVSNPVFLYLLAKNALRRR
ncbi:MAG: WecB/TagA/CpsF family glycosyltransferase [Rhodobacteraceae bacterium]|nr:WecB/TagA/CpsF family glycosyltransferase [Paracoccaceae bacterium]